VTVVAELHRRVGVAWRVLQRVPDPEIPAVSLIDLGIVREVREEGDDLQVVLTPTYSGCPATEAIASAVRRELESAGLGPVQVMHRLAPAWTTDWITDEGHRKLQRHGIAPPGPASRLGEQLVRFVSRSPTCPRCASKRTESLSEFGSTACKSLHRCLACGEPFEHFKPI
jgi:ring-1,2-phenylacetyl-CoA epoxidase subunit PaaD